MSNLRIFLADDHETVRGGLKLIIEEQPDMEVIGEANNGRDAVNMVKQLQPDVVVMDVSMPEMNGLKATEKLRKICPNVKILNLTRHTDDAYLQQLIKAGSSGYVLKQSAPTELIRAVRSVAEGNSYIDPALTNKLFGSYASRSGLRGKGANELTDRESDVLRMIAWGYSNKEIAYKMDISVKTVEAHKANSMKKLNFTSRIDIVRYAILQGWLQDS